MGSQTPNFAFPYPFNSDTFDPPSDLQALAEAIDTYLAAAGIVHMQKRYETADNSIVSDATLNTDTDLSGMTLLANGRYRLEGFFNVESNSTADWKIGLLLPASATMRGMIEAVSGVNDDALLALRAWTDTTALGIPIVSGTGGNSTRVHTIGHINVAATPGTLTFQWSQNTSDPGTTAVKAGSHLILTKLS